MPDNAAAAPPGKGCAGGDRRRRPSGAARRAARPLRAPPDGSPRARPAPRMRRAPVRCPRHAGIAAPASAPALQRAPRPRAPRASSGAGIAGPSRHRPCGPRPAPRAPSAAPRRQLQVEKPAQPIAAARAAHVQRADRRNAHQNTARTRRPPSRTASSNCSRKSRLSRSERRELRRLQRDERQNARHSSRTSRPAAAAARTSSPVRFAPGGRARNRPRRDALPSGLRANAADATARFAGRRAARLAARTAWHLGLLAPYVPWRGPVYWPYAYNDVFYYTFWPDAYDPGYWAYAYDDMFDGVFFPDGAPYDEYAAEGPYAGPDGRVTTGRRRAARRRRGASPRRRTNSAPIRPRASRRGRSSRSPTRCSRTKTRRGCSKTCARPPSEAAAEFKDACPNAVPMTPPGRLQAMLLRLKATDEAIQTVKPALAALYKSLNDEQKARFNEIGAQLGQPRAPRRKAAAGASKLQRREGRHLGPCDQQHRGGGAADRDPGRRPRPARRGDAESGRGFRAACPNTIAADAGRTTRCDAEAA